MIKSISSSSKKGWFNVNDEIEIHFFDEDGQLKVEAEYDTDKHSDEYISKLASEVLNVIFETLSEKNKSSCGIEEGNQCF